MYARLAGSGLGYWRFGFCYERKWNNEHERGRGGSDNERDACIMAVWALVVAVLTFNSSLKVDDDNDEDK